MSDTDIVTWLRSILHNDRSVELRCQEAANEIERLRNERDEARRRFCEYAIQHGRVYRRTPQEVAEMIGWDCFKENTNV